MSLVNTLMQPLREEYSGRYDKNESRPSRYGAFDFMSEDGRRPSSIFSQDLRDKIRMSFDNTVQVPVIQANDITISNVRSCTIADDENTSVLVNLVFVTYAFDFTMYPSQYRNNDIKYQEDFTRKLNDRLIKFAATLDSQAIATMESNRNQFFTGLTDFYPNTGNALRVSAAQQNDYYNNLQAIKETMDFYDEVEIVSSTKGSPLVRRLDNQGSSNATNESFQIDPFAFRFTNRIANGAGVNSTHYAITHGSTAIETRIDPDAEANAMIGDGQIMWEAVNVPLPGSNETVRMGSFFRADCADASNVAGPASAGLTRSKKESFAWSADFVFGVAYNSNPAGRYGPILKTEILSS